MKLQKAFVPLFLVVITTGIVVPTNAFAQTTTPTHTDWFSGVIQFVAQRFGIDQNQVKSAVTDYTNQKKQQMQKNMQDREKKRLDMLVSQNKITSGQEQQILDEQTKLKNEYNPADFKNLTTDQRKQKMQQEQAEIKTWSQSTGIDAKYLMPGFGMGMHMRMFNKWNNKITSTPTP